MLEIVGIVPPLLSSSVIMTYRSLSAILNCQEGVHMQA